VRGDRILEVPGITDERPSRSPRRPKKTRMTGKSAIRRQPDGAQRRVYRRCSFTHDCTKAGGKVEPQISKEPFPGGCSEDQRLTVVGRDRSNAAARSIVPVVAVDWTTAGERVDDATHVGADAIWFRVDTFRDRRCDAIGTDHESRRDPPRAASALDPRPGDTP